MPLQAAYSDRYGYSKNNHKSDFENFMKFSDLKMIKKSTVQCHKYSFKSLFLNTYVDELSFYHLLILQALFNSFLVYLTTSC